MTDPNTIERPTLLTQRTIVGIAAAVSALVFLIVCILTWHGWAVGTDSQRIQFLGEIALSLIVTLWLIIVSFSLPTNVSEKFSGPGVSLEIDQPHEGGDHA